jgi:arylsulfate sulfotransferase
MCYDGNNKASIMSKSLIRTVAFSFLLAALPSAIDSASPQLRGLLSGNIEVNLNPTGIVPLAALATFETRQACDVQMRIPGRVEVVQYFKDGSTSHEVPILGLYPGRTNIVFLTLIPHHGTPETRIVPITTDPLPAFLPDIVIETSDSSRMEPGMTLCDLAITIGKTATTFPIIFDRNGEVRWYLDLSALPGFCVPFERLSDGNFVFGIGESIFEYDMLGRRQARIVEPNYNFHHDIREIPGNRFLAAVDKRGTTIINSLGEKPSIEDHVLAIDRGTGRILNEWDLRKILDVRRNEAVNSNGDWFHNNAIWYSPADNCLILSGRHQGVVKVTWDNRLVWIFSPRLGWGPAGWDGSGPETSPYLLTAVDAAGNPYTDEVQNGFEPADDFDWSWGQHNAQISPGGTMSLFDNGDFRNWITYGPFSRFAEFRIDEKAMTVTQIWDYGRDRGSDLYSRIISSVDVLPQTGNRGMSPGIVQTATGSYAKYVELTYPGGEVVFEAKIKLKNMMISPGAAGFDAVYRSHRVSLYP